MNCEDKYNRSSCGNICGTFQRSNFKQGKPANSGDTATTEICKMESGFDDIFNPFSRQFKQANRKNLGRSKPQHLPFAKVGTGAANREQSCKVNRTCQQSDNDNAANLTCKLEQDFENRLKYVREC